MPDKSQERIEKARGIFGWLEPGEYISKEEIREKLGDSPASVQAATRAAMENPDIFRDTSGSKVKGFWRRS